MTNNLDGCGKISNLSLWLFKQPLQPFMDLSEVSYSHVHTCHVLVCTFHVCGVYIYIYVVYIHFVFFTLTCLMFDVMSVE